MQGLRVIALAWLMAAAAAMVSRDVPEATLDPLSIKAKRMAIDDAAMKADRAASLAMEEARQEEEEEKAIESSVEDGSGLDGSKPLPVKVVKSAEEPSRSQLAERVMKLMGEAPAQSEKLQSTEVAMARLKKAMQRRLKHKKEAGQKPAEVKTEELARIEAAEAETKQKMAALRRQKSEQEAQLAVAEAHAQGIQAEAKQIEVKLSSVQDSTQEANEDDLDAFVHKVVMKKFGKHWKHANTAAVKLAEARMKKLVESKLKQKMIRRVKMPSSASQSPKLDIEAMVEKKLSNMNSRLHLSKAAVERIRKRMKADLQRKLSPALAQPAAEGKSAGRPANAMVHVGKQISRVQEDDEEGAKDAQSEEDSTQDDSEQDDAQSSSTQEEDGSGASEESSASSAEEKSNSNDAEAETEDSHDEEADSSSDDEDSEPAAEAFLQRLRAKVRQPVLFSTEDADLQPYLHPKTKENPVSDDTCEELCKFKTGSECVTECHSFADAGGDVDALKVSDSKRAEDPARNSAKKQAVEQVATPQEEPEVDAGSDVDALKVSAAKQDLQSDADLDDVNSEEALSTAEAQPEQDQVAAAARKQFLEP